jgi:glycosyltransferase involved in cell wall biosynthesis
MRPPGAPGSPPRPRILYATTREATYARNRTLIGALAHYGEVDVIAPRGRGQGFEQRFVYLSGVVLVAFRLIVRALRRRSRDGTLVLGFLAQPLTALAGPFWRGRIVADAFVSVHDTVCHDKRLAREGSWIGRAAKWLDEQLVGRADALLFDTEQHRQYFRTLSPDAFPPSAIVPVGARPMAGPPAARPPSERFHVLFAGSFIPLQGAPIIVEAAAMLRNEPIDFTLVGAGQELAAAKAVADRQGLTSVRFVGWVDLRTLDEWYHRADAVLGIFGPSSKALRVIPNKVFEALSIGQPVITGDTPAIRELVEPGQEVICCPVNDPAALAEAIRWASRHRDRLREIGRAGRLAFERHASEAAIIAALQPVFAEPAS